MTARLRGDRLRRCDPLSIDVGVAHRFNAYARAAHPREIAGLLRIVERDGRWTAVDLMIPAQTADPARFALDGSAIAQWCLDLHAAGREHEVREWCGLVHSHPSMSTAPSALDIRTLTALAGSHFAFSVICSAHRDTKRNDYACHYGQGAPLRLLVGDIGVRPAGGKTLAGMDSLSRERIDAIAAEVTALLAAGREVVSR